MFIERHFKVDRVLDVQCREIRRYAETPRESRAREHSALREIRRYAETPRRDMRESREHSARRACAQSAAHRAQRTDTATAPRVASVHRTARVSGQGRDGACPCNPKERTAHTTHAAARSRTQPHAHTAPRKEASLRERSERSERPLTRSLPRHPSFLREQKRAQRATQDSKPCIAIPASSEKRSERSERRTT